MLYATYKTFQWVNLFREIPVVYYFWNQAVLLYHSDSKKTLLDFGDLDPIF